MNNDTSDGGEYPPTFEEYVTSQIRDNKLGTGGDAGNYAGFLDSLLSAGITRKQILIIDYRVVMESPTAAMRALTRHYRTPVLTNAQWVPYVNSRDFSGKVVTIKCSTHQKLQKLYDPMSFGLWRRIQSEHRRGIAPDPELTFPTSHSANIPCGDDELNMGALNLNSSHTGMHAQFLGTLVNSTHIENIEHTAQFQLNRPTGVS
jgi:hypothetical protein